MPRKQKQYHFIYKTTNLLNGKYYVGMHSTDDLEDGYIGSGKRLWYSISKHGRENHKIEILEFLNDRISLAAREKEIVSEDALKDPLCMNLKVGGEGGFSETASINGGKVGGKIGGKIGGKRCWELHSDEMKKRSGARWKLRHENGQMKYDNFTGKQHTDETKKKIGEKNSISQTGEKNSQFGTKWINNGEVAIKIKADILDDYLNNGWKLGRKV